MMAGIVKSGCVKCEGQQALQSGEDSLKMADLSKRKRASTVPE
jgi:hypothetical protein